MSTPAKATLPVEEDVVVIAAAQVIGPSLEGIPLVSAIPVGEEEEDQPAQDLLGTKEWHLHVDGPDGVDAVPGRNGSDGRRAGEPGQNGQDASQPTAGRHGGRMELFLSATTSLNVRSVAVASSHSPHAEPEVRKCRLPLDATLHISARGGCGGGGERGGRGGDGATGSKGRVSVCRDEGCHGLTSTHRSFLLLGCDAT